MAVLTVNSGARLMDILNIRHQDAKWHPEMGILEYQLRLGKSNMRGTRTSRVTFAEDNNSPVMCPIRRLKSHITKWAHVLQRDENQWLFPNFALTGQYTPHKITRRWTAWGKKMGWPETHRLGAHSGRNTKSNLALALNIGDQAIMSHFNWRSQDTIAIYKQNMHRAPTGVARMTASLTLEQRSALVAFSRCTS